MDSRLQALQWGGIFLKNGVTCTLKRQDSQDKPILGSQSYSVDNIVMEAKERRGTT